MADNGGPTFTHALLPGNPAIDAGDDTTCPATDQRGTARPRGAGCDIGAFESNLTIVDLNIALEAVPAPGDNVAFDVTLYHRDVFGPATADKPWLVFEATGDDLRYSFSNLVGTADLTGDRFTLHLPLTIELDVYDIAISAQRNGGLKDTLVNLRDAIPPEELAAVDMGTLPEGNVVDDLPPGAEPTSIINALDASVLAAAISKQSFDSRVDFDRDGDVDVDDLKLLEANYLKASPVVLVTQ